MSEIEGKLISCDRCETEIFLKYLDTMDMDGGYTKYRKYEDLPDSWLWEHELGYLCPKCADGFREFVDNFMNGKVPPKWKVGHGSILD